MSLLWLQSWLRKPWLRFGPYSSLSFLPKDSERQHQLYHTEYTKLQNWIQGSERSGEAAPLKHTGLPLYGPWDSCYLGGSGWPPKFQPWYSCTGGGRSPRMQDWLAKMGIALWVSLMRNSEGTWRTWRREGVFEGGNSKGWMGRLSFCGLEPREMVHGGIWGYSAKRDHCSAVLTRERQLKCYKGINKRTGRITAGGTQMGNWGKSVLHHQRVLRVEVCFALA